MSSQITHKQSSNVQIIAITTVNLATAVGETAPIDKITV